MYNITSENQGKAPRKAHIAPSFRTAQPALVSMCGGGSIGMNLIQGDVKEDLSLQIPQALIPDNADTSTYL